MEEQDESRAWSGDAGLGPDPALVRELLVVRPGGLGDVVRAVPALRHLRATFPGARISAVVPGSARDLLATCPYVDRVIPIEQPSEARLERFDLAVSFARPDVAGEAAALALDEVRARHRACWRRAQDVETARGVLRPVWPERLPDADRMLRLSWLLGGSLAPDAALGLWPTLADRNGAARLVRGVTRPVALVHVGARDAARRWPADRWQRVVDLLCDAGLAPVLVGTAADSAATRAVLARVADQPLSLTGATSVGELVGLMERAALFVGGDTGLTALAGALGVASIVIGPASSLEHTARPGRVELVTAGPCAHCGEHACDHVAAPAAAVPLERVLARVELSAATARDRWNAARIA